MNILEKLFYGLNHIAIILPDLTIYNTFYVEKFVFEVLSKIKRRERQTNILCLSVGNLFVE